MQMFRRMAQDGLLTALLFPLRSLTLLFPSSDLADVTMWSGVEVELGGMHARMDGWMEDGHAGIFAL